jgi:hypothetical protein
MPATFSLARVEHVMKVVGNAPVTPRILVVVIARNGIEQWPERPPRRLLQPFIALSLPVVVADLARKNRAAVDRINSEKRSMSRPTNVAPSAVARYMTSPTAYKVAVDVDAVGICSRSPESSELTKTRSAALVNQCRA